MTYMDELPLLMHELRTRYQAQPQSEESLLLEQQRAENMLQAASAGIAPTAQELPQSPDPATAGVLPDMQFHRVVSAVTGGTMCVSGLCVRYCCHCAMPSKGSCSVLEYYVCYGYCALIPGCFHLLLGGWLL